MRKLLYIVSVLLLFTACAASPEKVAKKVTTALAEGDMETVKANGTEALGEAVSFMEKTLPPEKFQEIRSELKGQSFDHIRTEIDGDKAKVYFSNGEKEDHLDLVKEDGKWLVDVTLR